ncbi:MAG: FAD-dependent oxidoreductase, partial [Kiloniellales bacterium]|nr:FAD-dependent oxidoreductase [Kiloniellales bacterium]
MRDQARVVVIGGGAMGCSLLYHLTRLGWRDVMLVEKNELTAGSTWHAAGLCTHFAHNLTIMNLRAHSVRLYQSLEAETGQPVSFHPSGALRVTRSADRMDEFRHVQGLGRFAGFEFHILAPAELKEIYPLVETDGLLGAIYEPLDGHVDPSQATQAMAKGARDAGAEVSRHNPVEAIERTRGGDWRVRTREGDIAAEIVVNAAGTWCREIGAMMGLDLPVVPMLHQYLVTDRVAAVAARDAELPIIRDPEESWYLRQERDGFICGPYERGGTPWSVDGVPDGFGMELLPPDLERIADIVGAAMARVPCLAEAGIKTVVNGPITFTPDANPLIGPAFGLERAYLLTGSSMGVMEGGGAGRFLAEWIVGGEPPMDALAVDPRRFGGYADRDYRLAKAIEGFGKQFAIHYPFEERPAGRPKVRTPAYGTMAGAGAVFGAVYGWERPNWFARPTTPWP